MIVMSLNVKKVIPLWGLLRIIKNVFSLRDLLRKIKLAHKRIRDSLAFNPAELSEHQFVRFVYYQHLSKWIPDHFSTAGNTKKIKVVEFGGSNGVIAGYFQNAEIEIAPNFPTLDIQNLSEYSSESYDCVILDQILEHVQNPWKAVTEIRRILRKGGVCICATPFMVRVHRSPKDYWRFADDGLRELFHEFSDVNILGWGNRFTLDVTLRDQSWENCATTKQKLQVDLTNEPAWPIVYLTKAIK